ncbi:UNVERIFIED_CONTAM: hypothetical protein HDU68_000467 [Siphonaria sp. JEL0065]|nr:hypothetical protein HDU68_000467 [Siphonaria sp. JEL0065]
MERSTRRGWASNQALNASTSSLQELVNPTAPAIRWERSWTTARSFPVPPPHAIGNTPGLKIASVKAQFYKWNVAPDKEPIDFSEDDLYITDVPDGDEQDEEMDTERGDDNIEGGPKITVEDDNNDAMDTSDGQGDTAALKNALSASFGGDRGSASRVSHQSSPTTLLEFRNTNMHQQPSGLKLNTLATRLINDNAHNLSNTPPNSAI